MKISELIERLEGFKAQEGDVQVGFVDEELEYYSAVKHLESRDARQTDQLYPDDKSLTPRFVGLS